MDEEKNSTNISDRPFLTFVIYVIVAGIAIASVLLVLPNEFVYDDLPLIAHNPHIREFSNVTRFFSIDYFDLSGERTFRPVTTFTYYADAAIWGLKPFGFHMTSIILHMITTLLVLAIAKRYLVGFLPAIAAATLFSLHPLVVEPIAGISFREDPLAAAFCCASLLAFLKWRDRNSIFLLACSWLLYILALFSKESAGALPVLIFVLCIASRQKLPARRAVLAMSGYAVVAAAFIFAYFILLHGGERLGNYPGGGPLEAIPVMVATFGEYLKLFVNPTNLCLEYPSQSASWGSSNFLISEAIMLILLVSALSARRRLPGFAFGIALFFTHLIPISNLLPFGAVMANRYMYLPMIGLCIAVGGILHFFKNAFKSGRARETRLVLSIVIVLVLVAATTRLRIEHISVWENGETLWGRTADCCPSSSRAHTNYGIALLNSEKYEEAVGPLETAVALDPHYEALNALGTAYLQTGQWDQAISTFTRASARLPTSPFPPYNAGLAMMKKGDAEQALLWFRRAIAIFPEFVPAIYDAGNVYLRSGNPEQAIHFYQKAVDIEPNRLDARGNLAVALIQTGRTTLAEKHLLYILSKDPENRRAKKFLSEIRQQQD